MNRKKQTELQMKATTKRGRKNEFRFYEENRIYNWMWKAKRRIGMVRHLFLSDVCVELEQEILFDLKWNLEQRFGAGRAMFKHWATRPHKRLKEEKKVSDFAFVVDFFWFMYLMAAHFASHTRLLHQRWRQKSKWTTMTVAAAAAAYK